MTLVLDLEEAARGPGDSLGGKGRSLAWMTARGLPVPDGFLITTAAYDAFINGNDALRSRIEAGPPEAEQAQREWFESVQEAILRAELPAEVQTRVTDAWRKLAAPAVAVRSSVADEDGEQHSFAGQYETQLNLGSESDVLNAVRHCWASLWSYRASHYRREHGLSVRPPGIALVVQTLTPARVSGVAFTRSPHGGDSLLIEAGWGLGEAIVSGRTGTDTYLCDRDDGHLQSVSVGYKLIQSTPSEQGGIVEQRVDDAWRNSRCLSDEQAQELGRIVLSIPRAEGEELDVEWAFDGERFHLLQARPITVESVTTGSVNSGMAGRMFTVRDIGESWSGVMTPLGQSFVRRYMHHTHGPAFLKVIGMRDAGNPDHYGDFVHGRPYADVSYMAYLLSQSAIFRRQSDFLGNYSSEDVDAENYHNPWGKPPGGWPLVVGTWHYLRVQIDHWCNYRRRAQAMLDERLDVLRRWHDTDLSTRDRHQLAVRLDEAYAYFHKACGVMMPPYFGAMLFYDIVRATATQWLGEDNDLANRVRAGTSEMRSMDAGEGIRQLADQAARTPGVAEALAGQPGAGTLDRLRRDPGTRAFAEAVDAFLLDQGVRGQVEMDVAVPRWIDEPSYVLKMVHKLMMSREATASGSAEERATDRSASLDELLGELPIHKRATLRWLIRCYKHFSTWRESTRMCYLQGIWMVRRVITEVAQRLVDEGVIERVEDMGFLDYEGIRRYLEGEEAGSRIFPPSAIRQAKRDDALNRRAPVPPETFISPWTPSIGAETEHEKATELMGIAASPGRIEGRARVILDLDQQMDEFQPGEILITRFTDTAWTPLFSLAAGVVTDIGSVLTHSAIVAREMGIPAVVSANGVSQWVRSGDRVIVDGGTGRVTRILPATEADEADGVTGVPQEADDTGSRRRKASKEEESKDAALS